MDIYTGTLTQKNMDEPYKAAAKSFYSQRSRCLTLRTKAHPKYGGRGIKVKYSVRDFIAWWAREYNKKPYWRCATVSRTDHDGDYCFENIKLEEKSVNTSERNRRVKNSSLKRHIVAIQNNGVTIFNSILAASHYFNINRCSLNDLLRLRYGKNTRNGVKFLFSEVYFGITKTNN